jgi:hypothetical protein
LAELDRTAQQILEHGARSTSHDPTRV